ncbi:tyrosine decarboxylase [Strigomonas culicis]|uniref:Tyrosine decarboxylase n=1 Tax=Strigomonas culicis TaxID=28005 RepID=S9UF83_9TRYP|nr:tyrosine decarboxylase [Strigomonas culicis]|eukprot:EPY27394.1 tyrosine decarboxylase [Strigomonas culicis]
MGKYTSFLQRLSVLHRGLAADSSAPTAGHALSAMVAAVVRTCVARRDALRHLTSPTALSMLLPALVPCTQESHSLSFGASTDALEQQVVNRVASLLDVPPRFWWPVDTAGADGKRRYPPATGVADSLWPVASTTSSGDVVRMPDDGPTADALARAHSDGVFDFVKPQGDALAVHDACPRWGGGVLHSSAAESYTVLLHTARQQGLCRARGSASRRFVGKEDEERHQRRLVLYCSDQVDPLLLQLARVVGFTHIRVLQTVETKTARNFCLSLTELHEKVAEDLGHGRYPALVVATAGARCCGALDPLPSLAAFCRRTGVWLHVDASHGGLALSGVDDAWKSALHHADSLHLSLFHSFVPFALAPTASRASLLLLAHTAKVDWALQQLEEARATHTVNRWREPHRGQCDRLSLLPPAERDGHALLQQALRLDGIDGEARRRSLRAHVDAVRAVQRAIQADGRFDAPLDGATFGVVVFRWTMLADELTERLALHWQHTLVQSTGAEEMTAEDVDVHVGLVVLQKRLWVSVSLSQLPEEASMRKRAVERVLASLRVAADGVHVSALS